MEAEFFAEDPGEKPIDGLSINRAHPSNQNSANLWLEVDRFCQISCKFASKVGLQSSPAITLVTDSRKLVFMIDPSTFKMPRFFRIRQNFTRPVESDPRAAVFREFERLDLRSKIKPNQSVAITVGSRGIANITAITKAIVDFCKQHQALPFIVPSMGSHGGATAEGQQKMLAGLGITETTVGAPIRSSMETVVVAEAPEGFPVHFDRIAASADHVIVANRIKPHTSFAGNLESGLMKMMLIGVGKHEGAIVYHQVIKNYSFDQIVRSVGSVVLSKMPILCGLAILENAFEETALIEGVAPEDFVRCEERLLVQAKQWLPKLPTQELDILIVNQIGKEISGTGLDTNIVGRKFNDHEARPEETPKIKRICVRSLTPSSKGNAAGIGIAEFCRSEVVQQMDKNATRINCLTSGHITAAMIPVDYPDDRSMLTDAVSTIGMTTPQTVKMLWLHDTLHLVELECSEGLLQEIQAITDIEIIEPLRPIQWQGNNLPDWFPH